MEALLQLQKISKRFPGVKALDQVDLNVYPGKVMALMGENGAGKSTLMKVLTGIYAKDAGDIIYQGHSVEFKNPRQSQLAGISIIHQELNLIPELSIAENIFLGREFVTSSKRIMWTEMYAQADQLLQRLGVKYSSKEKLGHLSLGVQQMVEIAKALSLNAQVLIMDEPTDALTDAETQILFRVIRELRAEGRGIVYISHRLNEIFEICDQVTVLRDGQWIAQNNITAINEQQLIEMMVGRPLDDRYPYLQTTVGDVRLEVKNLEGHGVKDVSFVLRSAEILGVSGLMGSGRTELMKLLFGVNPITQGALYVQGALFSPSSPKEALRKGIAYISEDRKGEGLIIGLSVKANMTLGSLAYFTQGFQLQHQQETRAVKQFIQSFSIKTPSENQIVGLLSGGNQQKVSLAKGLMTRPKVLILDEPTRGVDVGAKREIYQLINEFKAQGGSIILVSSDMPEVLGMSDRILVMHAGVIVGEFDRQEATQEKLLSCAVAQL